MTDSPTTPIPGMRPPTAAIWDRRSAEEFAATAFEQHPSEPWVLPFILQGYPLEVGVAQQYIQPARRIPSGAFGNLSCVFVASDGALTNYISMLADREGAPVWVSESWNNLAENARPVGPLTETERETLEALRAMGGEATGAELAERLQLEQAAASNRLSNLERKGYVFRQRRSKREGDRFLVPVFSGPAPSSPSAGTPANGATTITLEVPTEVQERAEALAALQGVDAQTLLAQAWSLYLSEHTNELYQRGLELDAMNDDEFIAATDPATANEIERLESQSD